MTDINRTYQKNQRAYIIEAAVEYFISLLITDTFISNLLLESGVSAASTGIIIQLASFAFVSQLFSVFFRIKGSIKKWVTGMHVANQLMFGILYMVPGVDLPQGIKVTILVVMFFGGHIIANIVSPYKMSWLMSFVDDKSRGTFTANKEIVSLLGGMAFQLIMANRVDHYMKSGDFNTAFTLCAVTILVMALIHFGCLAYIKDDRKDFEYSGEKIGFTSTLREFFKNSGFLKVLFAVILWHVVTGMSVSFFGSYKLKTLDFSIMDATILACVSSFTRVIVSRRFGRYADKNSWSKLLYLCFIIISFAFLANSFVLRGEVRINLDFLNSLGLNTSEAIVFDLRKVMFILYSIIHGIAYAGINGGLVNIMFDFVPHSSRSAALGISNSLGGIVSFVVAICGGSILSSIQKGDDKGMVFLKLFDQNIGFYGQQVLSFISFVLCIVLIVYMKTVILKISKK